MVVRRQQVLDKPVIGCAGVSALSFFFPATKGIACMFMMALATATAWCISYTPNNIGVATQFLDSSLVFEAGDVARSYFMSRLAAFQVSMGRLVVLEEVRGGRACMAVF